ncbi:DUF664 domain-containing protein [Actinopolymorpha rutila]|uniref:Uncharacterized protein n=1 Tax=Actinopolymorpha rutila TaxID=446787 RepID=A0A852ZH51_9ACTN|nr:DUF664 domain-containing protein [Actinopolymorpha rutila]NYH92481.1 hypothetical protein [Actinopolymorpha rutila]
MANVEIGYFGDIFAREWPTLHERISEREYDTDSQADLYATEHETCRSIINLYRRAWSFADETFADPPLDGRTVRLAPRLEYFDEVPMNGSPVLMAKALRTCAGCAAS